MVSPTKVVPAFLGGFICIYGLVSGFVKERLFLSESLVAMVFGILIGPQVINVVDPHDFLDVEKFTLEFARYVIAIQVMAAGITLPRRYIVRKWRTMSMLLGPIMVVMWMVTAGIIHLMFEIGFKQSLLIASCAAPTDPILANSVVKGRYAEANVPKNVRDALSAESGINDGLGLPFLYFALYLLNESYSTGHAIGKWFYWIWCFNILLSVFIGAVVGYIARKLLRLAESHDLIDKESFLAFSIGLSVFIVGCLQLIRSDDVLCCFIAGHSFTWDDWFREETKDAHFQEVLDGLINVSFFIYFGTIIPWGQFNDPDLVIAPWRLVVAAIMVLLLRRLPVVVLMTRIIPAFRNFRQSLFAGWFGPIGVGALFFAEIVLEEIESEPDNFHIRSREIIQPIVMFLVFSSTLVHGITVPLMYIGKVVRTRSRSLSNMSLRSGIASRLSFINSREPAGGIHGVHIPVIDNSNTTAAGLSDSAWDDDKKYGNVYPNSSPPNDNYMLSPNTVKSVPPPPSTPNGVPELMLPEEGEYDGSDDAEGNNGLLGHLDLARTITIDDTPKVSRDQMDIHYRIAIANRQFQQHLQSLNSQIPAALSGPSHSHLHDIPARPHSAQDILRHDRSRSLASDKDIEGEASTRELQQPPATAAIETTRAPGYLDVEEDLKIHPERTLAVRIRSRERRHSESPSIYGGISSLSRQRDHQQLLDGGSGNDNKALPGSDKTAIKEDASDKEGKDGSGSGASDSGDGNGGLTLAADERIASTEGTRSNSRRTIMSVPEIPEAAYTRAIATDSGSDIVPLPLSSHHSLPLDSRGSYVIQKAPSVHAAHHESPHIIEFPEMSNDTNQGQQQQQQQGRHAQRSSISRSRHPYNRRRRNRSSSRVSIRRILRRRRRRHNADDEDDMCEFVGNRRNPVGRLQDGEMVDYDDPEDDYLEQSFMDNNVDDRFIDYLTLDLGGSIRKLKSVFSKK